ncbi:RRP15-like protein isoform X1 [Acanthochromis polyacanthus]|uniref:RRP15-like protein isoform X1 n=1 Tax=Acanthochromis polyacanthus TaxID=80966 RepID=UPI00223402E6|nr:RRP15-like protein isoform X1 [Acanthochromis polyacanthus]
MELVETHVQLAAEDPAEDADPQSEDQSDSAGGSLDGRSDDGDEKEEEEETGGDANANAGWAEVMAKILGKKTSESQSSILVKNKDLDKQKAKERQEQLERTKQDDKKRTWEMMFREKPDVVKDRDAERALQRIATRGVVQLFNAVRKHQKTVDDKVKEAGGSERKKAKVLSSVSKKEFIDVLRRSEGGGRSSDRAENQAAAAEEKPAWSVLREDFMMEATMKDWDKDSDQEEAGPPAGAEQGSDSD